MRHFPASGKRADDAPKGTSDLVVPFGNGGYVIRYMLQADEVTINAIRHTRQAGFR